MGELGASCEAQKGRKDPQGHPCHLQAGLKAKLSLSAAILVATVARKSSLLIGRNLQQDQVHGVHDSLDSSGGSI